MRPNWVWTDTCTPRDDTLVHRARREASRREAYRVKRRFWGDLAASEYHGSLMKLDREVVFLWRKPAGLRFARLRLFFDMYAPQSSTATT